MHPWSVRIHTAGRYNLRATRKRFKGGVGEEGRVPFACRLQLAGPFQSLPRHILLRSTLCCIKSASEQRLPIQWPIDSRVAQATQSSDLGPLLQGQDARRGDCMFARMEIGVVDESKCKWVSGYGEI